MDKIDFKLFAGLNPSTQEVIRQEIEDRKLNRPLLQTIIEKEFFIPEGKMLAHWRKRNVANGRMLYWSILYHTTPHLETSIGKMTGRDHSTINNARKTVATYIALEKDYREKTIKVLNNYYQRMYPRADIHFIKQHIEVVLELLIKNRPKIRPVGHRENVIPDRVMVEIPNEITKAI